MEDLAAYYFHQGTNFSAYEYLGCNLISRDNGYIYSFRTWAPNAESVELLSDFTGWNKPVPLKKTTERGVWELIYNSESSIEKKAYKFRIKSKSITTDKGDPYARFSRGGDDGASLVYTNSSFKWDDEHWLSYRKRTYERELAGDISIPMNIYEMHLGSFARHEDNTYLSYRELADILPDYLLKMGYTHVELMPIQEYPFDASWGYQICAFYAPSSRFGDPSDFKYLINKLHRNGIGVILDWVPAHFPRDEWGLFEFDGSSLYEYQGLDRRDSRSWGTRLFDLGREEVQSFLISNALYFVREFHIDGLRVDAVASMLYLDFDKMPGEWIPNEQGTNINPEGVAFLKKFNSTLKNNYPDVFTIAEESASFGKVTAAVNDGGLGFTLKWNMGWANDFYSYVSTDPIFRKHKHSALNFPILYAFKEKYCLPISHDEVVHGKKSFIDKMYGSYEDKFMMARLSFLFQMTFPGKKLLFMGTEYGQFREWDFENSLEWFMLDYDSHRHLRDYVRALNKFYLANSELWSYDFTEKGFKWLLADECEKNLIAYKRIDSSGKEICIVLNFSGAESSVSIPVNGTPDIELLFDTGNVSRDEIITCVQNDPNYLSVILPRYSGIIYRENNGAIKINL